MKNSGSKKNRFKLMFLTFFLFSCQAFPMISLDTSLNVQADRKDVTGTNPDLLFLNSINTDDLFTGNEELVMYRPVKLTNSSKDPFIIKTPTETIEIASSSTREVMLKEQVIDLISGKSQRTVTIAGNREPAMTIQSLIGMSGEEVHLWHLQRVTCYRITITDDYAEQLDFQVYGPVKFRVAKRTGDMIVIDVTLDAYKTRSDFENASGGSDADEYVSGFNIMLNDLYAPHKLRGQGLFRYTEW